MRISVLILIMKAQDVLNRLDLEAGRCTKKKVLTFARIAKANEATDEKLKEALLRAGCVHAEVTIPSAGAARLADYLMDF